MAILWTALYVMVFVWTAKVYSRTEGYYSTPVLFGLAGFVYNMAIPLEASITGETRYTMIGYEVLVSDATAGTIAGLGVFAYCSFLLGYRLSEFRPLAEEPNLPIPNAGHWSQQIPRSVLAVGATAAVIVVLALGASLAAVGTYRGMAETTYQSPVFTLLTQYAILSISLAAATLLCRQRSRLVLAVLLAVPAAAWAIYSSDKNPLLIALLAAASAFRGKRSSNPMFLVFLCVGTLALLTLAPVFSVYRGGGNPVWDPSQFTTTRIDPAGVMTTMVDALHHDRPLEWGSTYLQVLYQWVPRFIWPSRPLTLSQEFAQSNISNWRPGQGFGYSLLAESYRNFSILGPFIQYLLIGVFWGKVWKPVKRYFCSVSVPYWHATYYVYGYSVIVLMHREATVYIIKSMAHVLSVLLVASYVLDKRQSRKADRHRSA